MTVDDTHCPRRGPPFWGGAMSYDAQRSTYGRGSSAGRQGRFCFGHNGVILNVGGSFPGNRDRGAALPELFRFDRSLKRCPKEQDRERTELAAERIAVFRSWIPAERKMVVTAGNLPAGRSFRPPRRGSISRVPFPWMPLSMICPRPLLRNAERRDGLPREGSAFPLPERGGRRNRSLGNDAASQSTDVASGPESRRASRWGTGPPVRIPCGSWSREIPTVGSRIAPTARIRRCPGSEGRLSSRGGWPKRSRIERLSNISASSNRRMGGGVVSGARKKRFRGRKRPPEARSRFAGLRRGSFSSTRGSISGTSSTAMPAEMSPASGRWPRGIGTRRSPRSQTGSTPRGGS